MKKYRIVYLIGLYYHVLTGMVVVVHRSLEQMYVMGNILLHYNILNLNISTLNRSVKILLILNLAIMWRNILSRVRRTYFILKGGLFTLDHERNFTYDQR